MVETLQVLGGLHICPLQSGTMEVGHIHVPPSLLVQLGPRAHVSLPGLGSQRLWQDQMKPPKLSHFIKGNRLAAACTEELLGRAWQLADGAASVPAAPKACESTRPMLFLSHLKVHVAAVAEKQEGSYRGTWTQLTSKIPFTLSPCFLALCQEGFCWPVLQGHSNITKKKPT